MKAAESLLGAIVFAAGRAVTMVFGECRNDLSVAGNPLVIGRRGRCWLKTEPGAQQAGNAMTAAYWTSAHVLGPDNPHRDG